MNVAGQVEFVGQGGGGHALDSHCCLDGEISIVDALLRPTPDQKPLGLKIDQVGFEIGRVTPMPIETCQFIAAATAMDNPPLVVCAAVGLVSAATNATFTATSAAAAHTAHIVAIAAICGCSCY